MPPKRIGEIIIMNLVGKSLVRSFLVLAGGALAWVAFVSVATESSIHLAPALFVTLMAMYIIAFGMVEFGVHAKSVAGVPFEDEHERRRPSFVIPAVSTIALMIFVVSHAGSHQAIWAMV